ncbi:MAG: protoporphyrinogen oxidase [Candidatus Tectomicrobia bacterium RIFCSPLOWO2_12_FULL_69_37]|nr:MAG: protoporphyrinogen oxidase [Candidatus Tectomicrobia bacterium RIFCSPLOWO2_02_FULL_70_19]OGL64640.1 MAG: protoporphyrinogen oxidase [Candidatus Tectomicrobia bacterium RIFCSPLOWO2_12_FULL_69_37]
MTAPPRRALVLGGGIAGLAACLRLIEGARERGFPIEVVLLEASPRVGGAIETARAGGCLLEKGPDCFLSAKPEGVELCRELGLESRLIGTRPGCRRSFILRGGRLHPVPAGFYLLAPSSFLPFVTSPIFSPLGKLRMGLDLLLPRRRGTGDESLASFVRRRFGEEALDRMAQPMVAGIYAADPEDLSLEATMPQFLEMERRHRSVILALRRRMAQARGAAAASGPRYALFLSLEGGMAALVEALRERVSRAGAALRCGSRASGLRREGGRWRVGLEGGGEIEADALCAALPAHAAAPLFGEASPRLRELLEGIPYGSVATLNLVFRREQVAHPLDGMGFVVPAAEGRPLMACSFSSSKFAGRAPAGKVLLRAFAGGARGGEALALGDRELVRRLVEELRPVLGLAGEPEEALLQRYGRAMPRYTVGHLGRVEEMERLAAELPGVALAGSAYRGVGIPDCAAGAQAAAARLLDRLRGAAPPAG